MKKIIFIITFIIFFFIANSALAQSKILINEFLIDPQPQSVEIFNSGTESADVSDWIIDDSGGTTFYTIPKNIIIFPNQCLVFSADFNLNKTSADTVKLINNSQLLIDSFSYKSSSGSGISYYRFPDNNNNWTTGSANLGFYNNTNVSCLITPTPIQPTPTDSTDLTNPPTPTIVSSPTISDLTPSPYSLIPISYDNIFISEAMVNPPSGEKEWLEIYNDNDFPVFLSSWYIDDLENAGSSPKIFSLEISAKSYAVFNLFSSMFNNDGDSVRLLDFNKSLKDDFEYQKTEQGKSLGRTSLESDDFCLQEPSKNSVNNPCVNSTPTIIPTINIIKTKMPINMDLINQTPTNKPVSINRLIGTEIPIRMNRSGQILGTSNQLIVNSPNNKYLINFLTILSFSYSLLAITSILIKSKVLKNIKYDVIPA